MTITTMSVQKRTRIPTVDVDVEPHRTANQSTDVMLPVDCCIIYVLHSRYHPVEQTPNICA